MKSMKKSLLGAAVAAALGFAATAQASVVIDLFTDPFPVGGQTVVDNTVGGGGTFSELDGLTNVIGGSRDIFVETTAQTLGGIATTMRVGGGFMSYSQESGVTGRGAIQWDGNDNSAALNLTGLGGQNLTACGALLCDRITATVLQADAGFGYAITMADMDGSVVVLTSSTQFAVATPTDANYYFSWFNLADGTYFDDGLLFSIQRSGNLGAMNFASIGALQFEINMPFLNPGDPGSTPVKADIDLTLRAVTATVPEPSALALVGLALLGAGLVTRRRAATKA